MTARTAIALPTLYVALLAVWLALEVGLGPRRAPDLGGFAQVLITSHVLLAWIWCGWIAQAKEPAAVWWGGTAVVVIPTPLYTIATLGGALGWNATGMVNLATAMLVVAALCTGRRLGECVVDPALRRIAFALLQAGPAIALWTMRPVLLPLAGWPS